MAPRTARAKKATEIKSIENEAPKKGRGKAKAMPEPEVENLNKEESVVPEKKIKRGKKPVDDIDEQNGGRKKNSEENIVDNSKESSPTNENGDEPETNGDTETALTGKGRKKQPKKEVKAKEVAKGKKNSQQDKDSDKVVEAKSKGRGRKPKVEMEPEESVDNDEEEVKPDAPAAKGRKKGKQDKTEEVAKQNDEKSEQEPKKKETKGRKTAATKKVSSKQESEEMEEDVKDDVSLGKKKEKREAKKDEGKGDSILEKESEENVPEAKPTKGKRGKKAVDKDTEPKDVQDTGEPTSKRRRKAEDKAPEEVKKAVKSVTNYESIDFSNTSKTTQGKEWNFKISTWNVDGIRAWLGKGGLEYLKFEKPDILCLQETKCSREKLPSEITNLPGYHAYWLGSEKDGYACVGVYTTRLAMNVQYGLQNEELDDEGRIITAEYELFYLICTYVPNAGRKLVTMPKRLKWNEEFRKHVQMLDKKKPVIICGDMNVAHNEIDLTNPKTNKKNAGFTAEERAGMTELLGDGFVDVFRHFYPARSGAYTFWSYMFNSRAKNIGWRLDYFIVSQRLLPSICDSVIRDKVLGSDHCPLSLFLYLTSADKPKE